MTIEIACFILGGLLILIGMLGGGFQAKEINIPHIGNSTRIACVMVGTLFAGLAIFIGNDERTSHSQPVDLLDTSSSMDFRIFDELGDRQVSEQVTVVIDDRNVGTITVSAIHPNADLLVTVPKQGRYSYQLAVTAEFLDENDNPVTFDGVGQGNINVTSGKKFNVEGEFSGNTWYANLIEEK